MTTLARDKASVVVKKITSRLVEQMEGEKPAFLKECEFRPVQTLEEFRACSRLVYLEYLNKKYTKQNQGQFRLSLHQMIDKSTTFIALYKNRFNLGTLTLIEDSPMGVPMDLIYKTELDPLRKADRYFAEAGMLALNSNLLKKPSIPESYRMLILLYLFKAAFEFLKKSTNVDSLAACFHPRHKLFYRAMQFQTIGELKPYDSVKGHPAVGYWLDFNYQGDETVLKMKRFFGLEGEAIPSPAEPQDKLRFNLTEFGKMFIDSKIGS